MTFVNAGRRVLACAALLLALPCASRAEDDTRIAATREALHRAAQTARAEPRPPVIPRDAFLARPRDSDAQLAPDGRHVVYRRRDGQRTTLVLRALDDGSE